MDINYSNPNDMWMHDGVDPYKGMDERERIKTGCLQLVAFLAMLGIGLLLCALMSSCGTTKIVEVEKLRTDTVWENHTRYDSIYVERHDSIVTYREGDTVTVERWHWRDRWRDRVKTDTIYKSRKDTVIITKPAVDTEQKLTWWQQARLHIANAVLIFMGLAAIFYVAKIQIKRFLP
jgi:hypothetical protein